MSAFTKVFSRLYQSSRHIRKGFAMAERTNDSSVTACPKYRATCRHICTYWNVSSGKDCHRDKGGWWEAFILNPANDPSNIRQLRTNPKKPVKTATFNRLGVSTGLSMTSRGSEVQSGSGMIVTPATGPRSGQGRKSGVPGRCRRLGAPTDPHFQQDPVCQMIRVECSSHAVVSEQCAQGDFQLFFHYG